MSEPRIEVVAIGDELLAGDVADLNMGWLGRTLAGVGLAVAAVSVVRDDLDEIVAAIGAAAGRSAAVLVTGGLGPTSDDRTREALARLAGVALRRDPAIERALADRATAAGREPTELMLSQADLPAGARALPNPTGAAPGLRLEHAGAVLYALPGVPAELAAIVSASVLPDLATVVGARTPSRSWALRVAMLPEVEIARRLAPFEDGLPAGIRVAYLPSLGEVLVRLTGADAPAVDAAADQARRLLGDAVYATSVRGGGQSSGQASGQVAGESAGESLGGPVGGAEQAALPLAVAVVTRLRDAGASVAAAESLTGGLLAAELTAVPGASAVFRGSVTAYATELKASLLGVDEDLLRRNGAVHERVAQQMAEGVRERLGADYGLGVTGVAGPQPAEGKPVGTVFVGVAGPAGAEVVAPRLSGDRAAIRRLTVVCALNLLRRSIV